MIFYKLKKKNINKLILSFLILLIISIKFNFFINIYLIIKKDSNTRMTDNYGYCYPMGYGYIKKIIEEYNIQSRDINIRNKLIAPSSAIFLQKLNSKKKDNNFEILLNFKFKDLNKISRDYNVIDQENNCYLIKYTDD